MLARRGVPSGGPPIPPRARIRLFALLACRDEMAHLPGYIANVAPHVDGIVAFDDGSTDGSRAYLEARPEVLSVLRGAQARERWDEVGNYRALVEEALRLGGGWALSLDADERLERDFRARAERVIARGRLLGLSAYSVAMRELWDGPDRYRADGVWGRKAPPRLFRLRHDHRFDSRELHGSKVPLQALESRGRIALADLEVYHLGMIGEQDRRERRERYERLDPEALWQSREGYGYLTDPAGLELRPVPADRGWTEVQDGASGSPE